MTDKLFSKHLIIYSFLITSMLFNLFGCNQKPKDRAFVVFNEGVALSLEALQLDQKGKHEDAFDFNKKAITKFEETLRIDPSHYGSKGALGHSFYLIGEFRAAINWFEKAHANNETTAATFRELGLSKINLGQIEAGQKNLEAAFRLDDSQNVKDITADDLYDIGKLAFEYSDEYKKQGQVEKGRTYQQFSLAVLKMALDISNSRPDIAATLVEFTDKAGGKALADKHR
jgi:tetratricopeptide (TPR) repeat protein